MLNKSVRIRTNYKSKRFIVEIELNKRVLSGVADPDGEKKINYQRGDICSLQRFKT